MNTKIIVCCHKKTDLPSDKNFCRYKLVGKYLMWTWVLQEMMKGKT